MSCNLLFRHVELCVGTDKRESLIVTPLLVNLRNTPNVLVTVGSVVRHPWALGSFVSKMGNWKLSSRSINQGIG